MWLVRCLRQVLGVPAAFVSRISNAEVLRRAGKTQLSEQLFYKQLTLLRKVARDDPHSPLRADTFVNGSLQPQVGVFIRKVGRPRQEWTTDLMNSGALKFGSTLAFETKLKGCSAEEWKSELDKQFRLA